VFTRDVLCLLLQILLVADLDIKTRDVPTVNSINSLLSQYCKASNLFFCNFLCTGRGGGGPPTVRFAPVVPWTKTGPGYSVKHTHTIRHNCDNIVNNTAT
jgi:hypothetical protein